MNKLVKERLNEIDCKSQGFIIDGYPRTENQYKFMKDELEIEPDLVLALDCQDDVIMQRHKEYRVDPVTGRLYSMQDITEISHPSVSNRLKELPHESEQNMKKR